MIIQSDAALRVVSSLSRRKGGGSHGGWIGWGTLMAMLPERRIGTVILTNRAPSAVTEIVAMAVFDRLCGKDPIPWLDRFRTRRRQFVAQRAVDRQARQRSRKSDAGPSRALAEYAGEYEHPGYGRISIEAIGDALRWRFHGSSGELAHRHYDVFEMPENPIMLSPDLLAISFGYDREGNINRLTAPLEPLVSSDNHPSAAKPKGARGTSLTLILPGVVVEIAEGGRCCNGALPSARSAFCNPSASATKLSPPSTT